MAAEVVCPDRQAEHTTSATSRVSILIATPEHAFAEYITRPTAAATGRKIEHLFMGRLVAETGEIKLLREALNTVAAAQPLLPGGVGEIPMPEGPIRSY